MSYAVRAGSGRRRGSLGAAIVEVAAIEALESRQFLSVATTGDGLLAQYFNSPTPDGTPAVTRVDPKVNFEWSAAPGKRVHADNFSARWSGFVEAQSTGTTTLYTTTDDGVRLWVDGDLVIDNWTRHASKTDHATIATVAGQTYTVRMEYFDARGDATASLAWSDAKHTKRIIPQANLFSADRIAPSMVNALSLTVSSASTIDLKWTASADNVGVARYDVYRDGSKIGSSRSPQFHDAGLASSTTHSYSVRAVDAQSNASKRSGVASGMTLATQAAPTGQAEVPSGLAFNGFSNRQTLSFGASLSWAAPADASNVTGYDVYRTGWNRPAGVIASVDAGTTSIDDDNLFHDNDYTYFVVAKFTDGHHSAASNLLVVRSPNALGSPAGNGFHAEYYNGAAYSGTPAQRYDGAIDFDWSSTTPDPLITGPFTVEWRGWVSVPYSASGVSLHLTANGNAKLSINGATAIGTQVSDNQMQYTIPAGQSKAYIAIEYSTTPTTIGAMARLEWSSEFMDRNLVPMSAIFG